MNKQNTKIHSLAGKLTLLICLISVFLTLIAIYVSYQVHSKTENQFYIDLVANVGNTVAAQLDQDEIKTLVDAAQTVEAAALSSAEDSEGMTAWMQEQGIYDTYMDVCSKLDSFRTEMKVEDIYLMLNIGSYCIVVADPVEDICLYGYSLRNTDEFAQYQGMEPIEATVSDSEYGWLCSGYQVVSDANGNPLTLVGVDISMESVMAQRKNYAISVSLQILVMMVILSALALVYIRRRIVKPLHQLTEAAASFLDEEAEGVGEAMELNINTRDEIETLYHTIRQMEIDINEYTINLTAVTAEKERIGAELNVATQIQADMLPSIFPAFPDRMEFDIYATMDPAKEVGGDFYDYFLVDDEHLAMVMADVSGKGVPAALFMVISKTLIKNAVLNGMGPAKALAYVNNQLCENNQADMFCTCWLGIMEIATGKVVAANAGHEYPSIRKGSGEFELLKDRHGMPLGSMEFLKYREYEFEIPENGTLFVYTDGVPEATSTKLELFGTDRMLEYLNFSPDADPEELLKHVTTGINLFVEEAEQFDDITMLAMKRQKM